MTLLLQVIIMTPMVGSTRLAAPVNRLISRRHDRSFRISEENITQLERLIRKLQELPVGNVPQLDEQLLTNPFVIRNLLLRFSLPFCCANYALLNPHIIPPTRPISERDQCSIADHLQFGERFVTCATRYSSFKKRSTLAKSDNFSLSERGLLAVILMPLVKELGKICDETAIAQTLARCAAPSNAPWEYVINASKRIDHLFALTQPVMDELQIYFPPMKNFQYQSSPLFRLIILFGNSLFLGRLPYPTAKAFGEYGFDRTILRAQRLGAYANIMTLGRAILLHYTYGELKNETADSFAI